MKLEKCCTAKRSAPMKHLGLGLGRRCRQRLLSLIPLTEYEASYFVNWWTAVRSDQEFCVVRF